MVLQLCVALGANVWVTSGDERKISKAVELGAKGGVIYKHSETLPHRRLSTFSLTQKSAEDWPSQLQSKLGRGLRLDVVIDSGGGDICAQTFPLLKHGAIIVCYGM